MLNKKINAQERKANRQKGWCLLLGLTAILQVDSLFAVERGAYQMPYTRYESENATKGAGAALIEALNFDQKKTASEASNQQYVNLPNNGSYVQWKTHTSGSGVTLRFTIPDGNNGQGLQGKLDVFVNGRYDQSVDLSSYYAWQYFPEGQHEPNNTPGGRARMRFDEVHFKLHQHLNAGDTLKIQKANNDTINYGIDFIEIEPVPNVKSRPDGYVSITDFGAVANDNVDDLPAMYQAISAAQQRGTGVYLPAGRFVYNDKLVFEGQGIGIKGAGIWHTDVYFSNPGQFKGGIMARANQVEISDFYMGTINNRRFDDNRAYMIYKGFMGTYGNQSKINNMWVEHFEVGAWLGGYDAPYPVAVTRNLLISKVRFRNNYADGVNFSQGTSNSIVEHSNIRNGGDDGLAIWTSNSPSAPEGVDNIFRFNTIENNWRAGGVAIFGGRSHRAHNLLIKDCFAGSGMRFTTDFPGYTFSTSGLMKFNDITISKCGTSYDLWNNKRGAIEFNVGRGVRNMQFENIDIIDSQRHGVQLVGNGFDNITFNNIAIAGLGLDNVTRNVSADVYGGLGVMAQANSGGVTFNNTAIMDYEDRAYLNRNQGFNLVMKQSSTALEGITLSKHEIDLDVGATTMLSVTFQPAQASNKKLQWVSSNPSVVSVSSTDTFTAKVSAHSSGSAVINAVSEEGSYIETVQVRVHNTSTGGGGTDTGGGDNGGNNDGNNDNTPTNTSLIDGHVYKITAKHSGKALDVSGISHNNGAVIHQWSYGGGENQKWKLVSKGANLWQLKALHTGKCLELGGSHKQNGASFNQWDCSANNQSNQLFKLENTSNGNYYLRVSHSNKCADVSGVSNNNGATVHQWDCNGQDNAQWQFEDLSEHSDTNPSTETEFIENGGVYKITAKHSGRALDVSGISQKNGALIHQWGYISGENQQWQLVSRGSDLWQLRAMHTGKCMELGGAQMHSGATFNQWDCFTPNRSHQLFKLEQAGSNEFFLRVAHSNMCANVSNAAANNGAIVHQWDCNGQDNAKWRFEKLR